MFIHSYLDLSTNGFTESIDDSGSMNHRDGGGIVGRIPALQAFVARIAEVTAHFDTDGIAIRWINDDQASDRIKTTTEVAQIVNSHRFDGWTRIGTQLWNKVLLPLVSAPARSKELAKPVLVIIITDGKVLF